MRLIFDPIVLNPDGLSVEQHLAYGEGRVAAHDHNAPLLYLDPKKLTEQGISEAVFYANVERAINTIADFKKADPDYTKHHRISQMISPPLREEYRREVLSHAGSRDFKEDIGAFLLTRLEYVRDNPEATIAMCKRHLETPLKASELRHATATEEAKRGYRIKLENAIGELPPHLKTLLKMEKITLFCADELWVIQPIMQAASSPDANAIGMTYKCIDKSDVKTLTRILKEELLHYFDYKLGLREQKDYIRAADALLKDDTKMDEITALCKEVHGEKGKTSISNYPVNHRREELLVDYFHIHDHLMEKAPHRETAKAVADAQMEKLFGSDMHRMCQQFEAELKVQAKEAGRRRG